MRRVNPAQIALITSILLALIMTGIEYLLIFLAGITIPFYFYFISFATGFFLSGLAFRILYGKYIFANLHQIYRNILRLRHPNEPIRPFKENERDITSEINRILIDWSNESREEIDQLKQVEIYRREFLSNVSHELKTPIFSCQGYVHTLIDGGIDDTDVNVLYLNKASRSIDRLISIVDDLESISRLEAGELIVEMRTFDLNDLAKDVIESLEFQAREKQVRLFVDEIFDKPQYVFGDKDLIRQVLVNLLVNSIKYGVKNGQTEVKYTDGGDKIIVDIADNGIGIEKQHLPRLFERFYRVDKSRSRDQGGTGLGLAIVKHIIEAHHQYISVNSEIGKGTTFSFSVKKSK
jgi:two-component system phosphate regulon sensor histidine kinase PhoR